ncbi:glycosyltransferase [bacterium]|nr:glycosyltransferase [bacterium]
MSTSTQHLAASLAEHGHQVMVIAPKIHRSTKKFSIPGVKIVWLRSIPAGFYPDLRLASWSPLLHKALQDFAPEIVHVMSPMPVSLTGIAYAKMKHLPIVMTFHTYFMDPEYLKVVHIERTSKFVEELGWDLAKTVHARADVTIAPTDYVARDLHAHHFKQPILIIPSGMRIQKSPTPAEKIMSLSKKLQLPADKRFVVTIGRVSQEKNLRGLLRVWQQVVAQHPEAHLVAIGGGPDLMAIKAYAHDLELDNAVTFVGDVPHENILSDGYYELGDFFVTASLSETQGMTSVEAQIYGLPVVAYHSKGLPFVVGEAGVMVPENDETSMVKAIIDLLEDENHLQTLREKLLLNLARFDINTTTERMLNAYQLAITINQDQ